MINILIPIDFSGCSTNAVNYVAELSKHVEVQKIILMRSYYVSSYSGILPSVEMLQVSTDEIEEERNRFGEELGLLEEDLRAKLNPSIEVVPAMSDLPLVRAINDIIEEEEVDLVVVGSENDECRTEESYIIDDLVGIEKSSPVPVLVVPGNKTYEKIERAVVPCDFNAFSRLSAVERVHVLTGRFHGELLVLNVDPKQGHFSERSEHEKQLADLLGTFNYKLYYSDDSHILTAIQKFAALHRAQLLIALPGKYNFFYSLTHSSITEALAENSKLPVLILK